LQETTLPMPNFVWVYNVVKEIHANVVMTQACACDVYSIIICTGIVSDMVHKLHIIAMIAKYPFAIIGKAKLLINRLSY